jgi:PncC family amidohydrolase
MQYNQGDVPLEYAIGDLLREHGLTLGAAESCTGGLIAHRITNVPGSSDYFLGGVVAYANAVKERVVGVRAGTIVAHGAVSAETALEMAQGVRRVLQVDLALSTTGVAGPGGGTPSKPVGLVYVALAAADGDWVERHIWDGDRLMNKQLSADAALNLIYRYLVDSLTMSNLTSEV